MSLNFNFSLNSYLCFLENFFYNFNQIVRAKLVGHILNFKNYNPLKKIKLKFINST